MSDGTRFHIENLIKDLAGTAEVVVDDDGDYPVTWGDLLCYVSILEVAPELLQVFTVVAEEVEVTDKLFRELSEINSEVVSARVFLSDHDLVASAELVAASTDRPQLEHTFRSVAALDERYGNRVRARYVPR